MWEYVWMANVAINGIRQGMAQRTCEGCGAADFSAYACSYCRRPILDPLMLVNAAKPLGGTVKEAP